MSDRLPLPEGGAMLVEISDCGEKVMLSLERVPRRIVKKCCEQIRQLGLVRTAYLRHRTIHLKLPAARDPKKRERELNEFLNRAENLVSNLIVRENGRADDSKRRRRHHARQQPRPAVISTTLTA